MYFTHKNRGIWVIDRGGDRDDLYESLLKNKRDFIIRLVGSRDLISQGKYLISLWLAHACRLPYENSIIKIIEGKEVHFHIRHGFMPVNLPESKKPLTMVVIKGFGGQPMMLLISPEINSRETDLWFIVFAYLRRWGIEDTANFANRLMSENDNQVVLYSFNKTVNL